MSAPSPAPRTSVLAADKAAARLRITAATARPAVPSCCGSCLPQAAPPECCELAAGYREAAR